VEHYVELRLTAILLALTMLACYRAERVKQNRTMGDMATVGSLLESYKEDIGTYPDALQTKDTFSKLIPRYMKPENGYVIGEKFVDEWHRPLRYECWKEDASAPGCDHYALSSAGDDGKFEPGPLRSVSAKRFDNPDEDIVLRDGKLIRYPSYVQD
jgi:hypothetical protein